MFDAVNAELKDLKLSILPVQKLYLTLSGAF